MAPQNDQLLVNSQTLQDIGSTIVSDTRQLAADLQSSRQQFEAAFNSQGRKDASGHNLPACLLQDFEKFERQQAFDDLLQKRQRIGECLSTAVNLQNFQDQLRQKTFDIYSVENYYDSGKETISKHLQVPDGFSLHSHSG